MIWCIFSGPKKAMQAFKSHFLIYKHCVLLKWSVKWLTVTPLYECTHKRCPPPIRAQRFYHLPHLCLCTAVWLASVWRVTGQKYSLFFISITPFLTPPSFTSISPALPLFLLFFYLSNFRSQGEKHPSHICKQSERASERGTWVFLSKLHSRNTRSWWETSVRGMTACVCVRSGSKMALLPLLTAGKFTGHFALFLFILIYILVVGIG